MITRILDLSVILLLAFVVLLPRPEVRAKPAAELDDETRARIAELQADLLADPGAVEPSLALADKFLDARRPEWALAALTPAVERAPLDHRVHGRRALAYADHFAAPQAYVEAERALELCTSGSSAPCGPADLSRLELLTSTLERVKDIDMRADPNAAKVNNIKSLRSTFLPPPKKGSAGRAP